MLLYTVKGLKKEKEAPLVKGPLSHFFLIFILIVLCETSSMIPISVCSASRWGSYEGAKLQKRPIMRGRFRCSGPNNAKTS